MFGLTTLWQSISTLAGNVQALALTVAEVNVGIRTRLQLDGPAESPQLPGPAEVEVAAPIAGNGRRKAKVES